MQIQLIHFKIDWISLTDILRYSGIIQITLKYLFLISLLFSAKLLYILFNLFNFFKILFHLFQFKVALDV